MNGRCTHPRGIAGDCGVAHGRETHWLSECRERFVCANCQKPVVIVRNTKSGWKHLYATSGWSLA